VQHFTKKANATAEKDAKEIVMRPRITAEKATAAREIRPKRLEELAQLMTARKFASCLPLIFGGNGCIQDAVRRLRAIVARGKTLEFEGEFSS
jgi:hypothetical protein